MFKIYSTFDKILLTVHYITTYTPVELVLWVEHYLKRSETVNSQ